MKGDDVCAVVILYNPDEQAVKNVMNASLLFKKIFLIDNSIDEIISGEIKSLIQVGAIQYIHNGDNKGVATALNQGVELAHKEGFLGAVLLDQDTRIKSNILQELLYIYESKSQASPVAVVGSGYITAKYSNKSLRAVRKKTVITSGSLLSIEAFIKLGGFNENYFIDGVDLEFCLKARLNGYEVYLSIAVLMEHFIGAKTKHNVLGLEFTTSNHIGIRRYYLVRNTIFLVRDYFKEYPLYLIDSMVNIIRILIYIVLFESGKKEKVLYMLSGLKDGFLNVTGRKDEKDL